MLFHFGRLNHSVHGRGVVGSCRIRLSGLYVNYWLFSSLVQHTRRVKRKTWLTFKARFVSSLNKRSPGLSLILCFHPRLLFMIGIHIYPCKICVSVRDLEVRRIPDKYRVRHVLLFTCLPGCFPFSLSLFLTLSFFPSPPFPHHHRAEYALGDTKSFLLPRHVRALSVTYI